MDALRGWVIAGAMRTLVRDGPLRENRHLGGPRAQPQGHRSGASTRCPDRDHGPLGIGQVKPGVRHPLRRGTAPLCRVAVVVCAPVPGPDGEAGRRFDRRPLARDLDRPEDDLAQPALDRRHGHGDLRLPAPPVGSDRQAPLLQLRPAHPGPVARADHRPRALDRRGQAFHGDGAGRPRPQGRVRAHAGRDALAGLRAGDDRRRATPPRRGDRPRQEVQARHLDRGRPAGDEGGHSQAPLGVDRGGRAARRRPHRDPGPRDRRGAGLLRALRVPQLRCLDAGDRASDLLVQLAARRLRALPRPRLPARDRPRADRPRPDPLDLRRRARPVDEGGLDVPPAPA